MLKFNTVTVEEAIQNRNKSWMGHPLVTRQDLLEQSGLDRFFTPIEVAKVCYDDMIFEMMTDYANPEDYTFIEPSAGDGSFLDLLPPKRRIGIDILPMTMEVIEADYLTWEPPSGRRPYAVIGNPPFGTKGWMALPFMQKSAAFADYIGMILPMSFSSESKSSLQFSVIGATLIKQSVLPRRIFSSKYDDMNADIFTVWQVWKRGVNNFKPHDTCDEFIDVIGVRESEIKGETYKSNTGKFDFIQEHRTDKEKERIEQCDLFVQCNFFTSSPDPVPTPIWSEIKYGQAHGVIIKKEREKVETALKSANWRAYSNLSVNKKHCICKHHVYQVLIDAGLVDGKKDK